MTAARLLAPVLALLVAAVTALTGLPPAAATGATAAVDPNLTPLSVHIDSLNHAALPRHGRLVVTGTVSNDSNEVWRDINVHPLTSYEPMTTRAELTAAAATPADTYVGARLTAPHTFEPIGDLSPGETAHFRLSLPISALDIAGTPGVYWFGIHALGANSQGSDDFADGRARTFIPLLPRRTGSTQAAIVVPLRAQVRRDPSGALLDQSTWTTQLGAGGLLARQLSFVRTAQGVPLTWLVDPAVLQAVDDIAHGNPPLSYGEPTTAPTPSPSPGSSPSPSQSPAASPNPSPSGGSSGTPASPSTAPAGTDAGLPVTDPTAEHWLTGILASMSGGSVLGLPYADPDVVSVAHHGPDLLRQARSLGEQTFSRFGVPDSPALAPVDGLLDQKSLREVRRDTTLLLSDRGQALRQTQWRTRSGQDLVFTDARAASGGPAPTPPLDALALRQRIVAAAALRALHGVDSPMVVVLPDGWDPGTAWQRARFFPGLEGLPWLQLSPVTPNPVADTFRRPLDYPRSAAHQRIHPRNVAAARRLVNAGQTLASVLASGSRVSDQVTGAALGAVSYHARESQRVARQQVNAFDQTIHHTLSGISIAGTDFVTLSGKSGSLTVSLVNGLQVPITVGLRARSDSSQVRVDTPEPVQVAAGQRTTVRLPASSRAVGVHQITLTPVSESGQPVGTPLVFSLRTSDVGRWIWLVLGAGGALLVFAVIRRVVRRIAGERHR